MFLTYICPAAGQQAISELPGLNDAIVTLREKAQQMTQPHKEGDEKKADFVLEMQSKLLAALSELRLAKTAKQEARWREPKMPEKHKPLSDPDYEDVEYDGEDDENSMQIAMQRRKRLVAAWVQNLAFSESDD